MNELKLFEDRHEVMILTQEDVNINFKGDFLIRVKDVANVLEYKQAKDLVALIKPKYICLIRNSNFAKSEIRKLHNTGETFVTSFGLNQALASSTMPKAEPFQDWLYEEMLPSIQTRGYYAIHSAHNVQALSPKHEIESQKLQIRKADILLKVAKLDTTEAIYSKVLRAKAVEIVAGERLLPMPAVDRGTCSAEEVAKMVGLKSGQAVGKIANRLNIKPPEGEKNEYGEWEHSKSRYSSKQVKQFMYTNAGVEAIRKEVET